MGIIKGLSVLFVAATLMLGLSIMSPSLLLDGGIIAIREQSDILGSNTFDILPEAFGDDSGSDSDSDSASTTNSDSDSDSDSDSGSG